MRRAHYAAVAAFLASCLFANLASAQTEMADQAMRLLLQRHIPLQPGRKVDDARNVLLRLFEATDVDGGGVSETDHALRGLAESARSRASFLRVWLVADLDGDGQVTKTELENSFGPELRESLRRDNIGPRSADPTLPQFVDRRINDVLQADANNDRIVTFEEALAFASARFGPTAKPAVEPAIPVELDADGDGTVSETELQQALDRALSEVDKDGDGTFSDQEIAAYREAIARSAAREEEDRLLALPLEAQEMIAKCAFPAVPAGAKISLAIVNHGRALAMATIGDRDDDVSVADIRIESGSEPLYLILSSYRPMIWRFSGQVGRVTSVVANSQVRSATGAGLVGLIGLPKDVLYVPPSPRCLPYVGTSEARAVTATIARLSQALGQRLTRYLLTYSVSDIQMPSGMSNAIPDYPGAEPPPPSGPGDVMWRMALRAFPGGLIPIDPAKVVSPLPVSALEVFPQEAGIAQLLSAGAMRVSEAHRVTLVGGLVVMGGPNTTVVVPPGAKVQRLDLPAEITILQKIRMPARVDGALYQFRLAPGVPEPDGMTDRMKLVR